MRTAALLTASLLLAGILAGCSQSQTVTNPTDSTTPTPAASAYHFAVPLKITQGRSEPSIAAAADGTLWFTAIQGLPTESPIWRSTDHGKNWTQISPASTMGKTPFGAGGGDTDLAVDGHGRVGISDLWAGSASFWLSADKGATWSGTADSGVPFEDRNWITATNTTFYHIGRIFTGGATWVSELQNTPEGSPGGLVWVPKGVVWQDGDQNGGFVADKGDNTLYDSYYTGNTVRISVSSNAGTTWAQHDVVKGGAGVSYVFTPVDVDRAHNVYVAWVEGGTTVRYAASKDHGVTWGKPVDVTVPGAKTMAFPWVSAGSDGRIAVSYHMTGNGTGNSETIKAGQTWDLVTAFVTDAAGAAPAVAFQTAMKNVHKGTISVSGLGGGADRSLGDFFETTVDPTDGSLVLGFASDSGDMWVTQTAGPSMIEGKTIGVHA